MPLPTPRSSLTLAASAILAGSSLAGPPPAFRAWAPVPPMGWNSWDCFGTTVTEKQVLGQAAVMAERLRPHGWQYVVVDIQWYEPEARSHSYREGARLEMDGNGRLLPAPNKFPSSAGGAGFGPLAARIHAMGLKFGVHLMRGIPRQAVERNLPVLGTSVRAADIANKADSCPWNKDMYGVDASRPGAQAYYDSVFALLASWGVDYVKVDDMSRPYLSHEGEIEAVRRAIDRTGRPIVLSLSPGETALEAADHAASHANLWRISDDFWDRWLALHDQFHRLEAWNPHRLQGAWPDADMLPLGLINLGERRTRFTPDEQRTMMTLWCVARSPLLFGGDLTRLDEATLALITNDEVLAVDQASEGNRPLFNRDDLIGWTARLKAGGDTVLALFNARDPVRLVPSSARYASAPTAGAPACADVDADLAGASRLFLAAFPADPSGEWDRILWRSPRLVMADGSERPLEAIRWTHADAAWDSTAVSRDAAGGALGIQAEVPATVEFGLPAGAVRLRARAEVTGNGRGLTPGPVRFLVVCAGADAPGPGLPLGVGLASLGYPDGARVRDLWARRDLGTVSGEFAPVVPFHGAGLYRLSAPAR
jgi:alpha-galactosidase